MIFALGSRQHLLDIVEAADQARTEIEPLGVEGLPLSFRTLRCVKTRAKHLVQDRLEGGAPPPPLLLQPDCDIVIEGEGRAHTLMLLI